MVDSDELKRRIVAELEEIKLILKLRGFEQVNQVAFAAWDTNSPETAVLVSNNNLASFVIWNAEGDRLPSTDMGWVLMNVRPPKSGYQPPDYMTLGTFDREWRTQIGKLQPGHTVTHWAAVSTAVNQGER